MSFRVELPGAEVLFSTREGGFSEGPYESLNLGLLTGDDRPTVVRNRRRLADEAAVEPENVAMGWQVHGTDIKEWEGPDPDTAFLDPQGGHVKVDGHLTRNPALATLVLVADCLPVAIAGGGSVAMLHCGWRGLAGGLIAKAAERMRPPDGGARPRQVGDIAAAVGPGIGRCCYEVGDEVFAAFAAYEGVADGRMLNLRAIAEQQLRSAGIDHVEHVDYCTSCHPELFFSHRRDNGVTGRQGGIAWLTG
ncbi:MAG TPA: polyphenol oxidase family protein [Thermoleophilaceae bacterium]|nr:polyphenol oxidase family protein [Thermoleophilaceae bacterium]